MHFWRYALLGFLSCLLAVGCQSGTNQALMERELRMQEDRIFQLEYELEHALAMLDTCHTTDAVVGKPDSTDDTPSRRADPDVRPGPSRLAPPSVEGAPSLPSGPALERSPPNNSTPAPGGQRQPPPSSPFSGANQPGSAAQSASMSAGQIARDVRTAAASTNGLPAAQPPRLPSRLSILVSDEERRVFAPHQDQPPAVLPVPLTGALPMDLSQQPVEPEAEPTTAPAEPPPTTINPPPPRKPAPASQPPRSKPSWSPNR